AYVQVPLLGKLPLASAVVFDLGVFTLVVGATVLILIALAHQSIRRHRPPRAEAPPSGAGAAKADLAEAGAALPAAAEGQ
ncbi:hypothetical protein ADS78_12915, partial [Idiomarina abyssalis]|uniref:hypothetical protein n=1 Tax=Idiomarina abyssalis TaxID=86102 RepID=UPI0006CC464C